MMFRQNNAENENMEYDTVLIGYAVNSTSGGYTNENVKYLDTVGIKYLYSHFYGTYCAEPVAFLQLAAEMRSQGIKVKILDGLLMGYNIEELKIKIEEVKTNIYCFSLYESSKNDVVELMAYVKQQNPDAVIITGGPYVTLCYAELIETYRQIDYIVIGDGDIAMPKLVNALKHNGDVRNIPNIVYADNGKAVMDCQPLAVNLDTVHDLERDFYEDIKQMGFSLSVVSSRGCGYANCSFCYLKEYQKNANQPKFRYRNPQKVVNEIMHLVGTYGIEKLTFVDEDFFGNNIEGVARALEIFDLLKKNNINLKLYMNVRVASIKYLIENNLLAKCAEGGAKYFFVGFESYNDDILKRYKKGITTKDIDFICDKLEQNGIQVNPGMITFDYSLTPQQVFNNITLLRRVNYYDAFMFTRTLMILPNKNTKMKDNRVKKGGFLYRETETLYNLLVEFRDQIYELYMKVKRDKINDNIRNNIINEHYAFFFDIYNAIMQNSGNYQEIIRRHKDKIESYVKLVS